MSRETLTLGSETLSVDPQLERTLLATIVIHQTN